MNKILLLFTVFTINAVSAQHNGHTWESIHQEYLEWVQDERFLWRYEEVLKEENNSIGYIKKRLSYAWILGKMDDVYNCLQKYADHPAREKVEESGDWFLRLIMVGDMPSTEWRRNGEMMKRVLEKFDQGFIRQQVLSSLVLIESHTGQIKNGIRHAEELLDTTSDGSGMMPVKHAYIQMLIADDQYEEAASLSVKYYKESDDIYMLGGYYNAIYAKGDPVEYLLLEDSIRKHRLYTHYFRLMDLHMERGDDEALQYYLDWFEDSVQVGKYDNQYYMRGGEFQRTYFGLQDIQLLAQYYISKDQEKVCELYSNIMSVCSANHRNYEWESRQRAERYLAAVGTESEEEYMWRWQQEVDYIIEVASEAAAEVVQRCN